MISPIVPRHHIAPDGPESSDWLGVKEASPEQMLDLPALIRKLFPVTYSDPTGQRAMHAVQKNVGWFEPDADVYLRIRTKTRGTIDIRLDFELKSLHMELLNRAGDVSQTQSRRGYRARIKKNTPTAVEKFGDSNCSGGSNTKVQEDH